MKQKRNILLPLMLVLALLFSGCSGMDVSVSQPIPTESVTLDSLPEFDGSPFIEINDNIPAFTAEDLTAESYESYSPLDSLGRCGVAVASIGVDIMPTEERKSIGQVKPSGWQTVKYDFVEGKYLYNRCHLIGFQLTGENANESNLITGTRYLNVEGMLPFENMTADYIKETGNHVLYRVTPVFTGENLVADGVLIEAESVEDNGEGICFCVYCYNVQPGVAIDYATGESRVADGSNPSDGSSPASESNPSDESSSTDGSSSTDSTDTQASIEMDYVLNTNSKKFHKPDCSSVSKISEENRRDYSGSRQTLLDDGYEPCGICKP